MDMVEGIHCYFCISLVMISLAALFSSSALTKLPCPVVQENWDYIAETFTGHLLTYFITVTVSPVNVITCYTTLIQANACARLKLGIC